MNLWSDVYYPKMINIRKHSKKKWRWSVTFRARIAAETAPSVEAKKWTHSVRDGNYGVSKVLYYFSLRSHGLIQRWWILLNAVRRPSCSSRCSPESEQRYLEFFMCRKHLFLRRASGAATLPCAVARNVPRLPSSLESAAERPRRVLASPQHPVQNIVVSLRRPKHLFLRP